MRVCAEPGCPEITPTPRCPAHTKQHGPNATRSTWRNRADQARFRKAVLTAARHRCQHPGCIVTGDANLQAHHTQPGNDDPKTGRALCHDHHRLVDPHAR